MRVRRANRDDVSALLEIKQRLAFSDANRGGFLLGCDEAGYFKRLRDGRVWVLEAQTIVGFAVTMSAEALRGSELWAARERIRWHSSAPIDTTALGYFDQLAVLPGARLRPALELAFTALWNLLESCSYVVTTTVAAPVTNLAAVPLIERLGGERLGQLEETYPGFGRLTSDLWLLPRDRVRQRLFEGRARVETWARQLTKQMPASD